MSEEEQDKSAPRPEEPEKTPEAPPAAPGAPAADAAAPAPAAPAPVPVAPAPAPAAAEAPAVPAAPRPRPAPPTAGGEGGGEAAPAAPRPAPAPRAPAGPSPAELAQRAEVPSVPLDRLRARFPEIAASANFFSGVPIVAVSVGAIAEVCQFLKDDPDSRCTYLSNLHGTHNPDKKDKPFEVVYHLYSIDHANWIELKVELGENEEVPTVTGVWKTANWHEREAFDMLGIRFAGHPDLTRILLPDDWKGHPLRKEYPLEGNPGDHKYYR